MTKPSTLRPGPSSDPPGSGFQAQIQGASLADLIQMECLASSQRVVRVTSGQITGYMYFRGGSLVHAIARSLTGEAAALDMLSWNDGSFDPIEREWPTNENISCTWQSLLIRAAQIRDERQAPGVVTLRTEGRLSNQARSVPVVEDIELNATPIEVAGHVLRLEDFDLVLHLKPSGAVVRNEGSTQDFADIVAYACRLTLLIGNDLGIDRFVAMECSFKSGRCFVVRESTGDVIALRPRPSADAASIRELFGI